MQFNILFKFLQNVEFEYVQHLFLTLFGCSEFISDIDLVCLGLILKYCKITSFFTDMANAILLGDDTLDPKKSDIEYKPIGIGPLIRPKEENPAFFFNPEERPMSYNVNEDLTMYEEHRGYNLDIDNLQTILKMKKNTDLKRLKTLRTVSLDEKIFGLKDSKLIRKYPSLLEKYGSPSNSQVTIFGQSIGDKISEENSNLISTLEISSIDPRPKHKSSKSTMTQVKKTPGARNGNIKLPSLKDESANLMTEPSKSEALQRAETQYSAKKPSRSLVSSPNSAVSNRLKTPGAMSTEIKSSHSKTTSQINFGKKASLPHLVDIEESDERGKSLGSAVLSMITSNKNTPKEETIKKRNNDLMFKKPDSNHDTISSFVGSKMKFSKNLDEDANSESANSKSEVHVDDSDMTNRDPKAPKKVTIAREFRTDTLDKNDLKQLNRLYPLSTRDIMPTDMDTESKRPEFNLSSLKNNEGYSLSACQLLLELFTRAFSVPPNQVEREGLKDLSEEERAKKEKYFLNKNIGVSHINYTEFWDVILAEDCKVFELIFKVSASFDLSIKTFLELHSENQAQLPRRTE